MNNWFMGLVRSINGRLIQKTIWGYKDVLTGEVFKNIEVEKK